MEALPYARQHLALIASPLGTARMIDFLLADRTHFVRDAPRGPSVQPNLGNDAIDLGWVTHGCRSSSFFGSQQDLTRGPSSLMQNRT